MLFKQEQIELVLAASELTTIGITCSGNVRELIQEVKLYDKFPYKYSIGYIFNDDLMYASDHSPVYIIERIGETIECVEDLAKFKAQKSSDFLRYPLRYSGIDGGSHIPVINANRPVTSVKVITKPKVNINEHIGIMLPPDMYNKDLAGVDTLIMVYDGNDINIETLKGIISKYVRPQSTSDVGGHLSQSYVDIASLSTPKEGQKCWRRIVFEDTKGRYTKSETANRLKGDNVMVVNIYKTESLPKYSLDMLIGGNNVI